MKLELGRGIGTWTCNWNLGLELDFDVRKSEATGIHTHTPKIVSLCCGGVITTKMKKHKKHERRSLRGHDFYVGVRAIAFAL